MANSNPKTDHLSKYPKIAPEGSAKYPVQVRVPKHHYEAWMKIPAKVRNESLRQLIAQKIEEYSVSA